MKLKISRSESLSCPKVILRADTALLGMKHRLWEAKLMYVIQLKRVEERNKA